MERRQRDEAHRRFGASQPCFICGRSPTQAHHLRFAQPRSMGSKACPWRLRRVYRIECGLFIKARPSWHEGIVNITPDIAVVFLRLAVEDDVGKLQRYEAGLERSL
jgi:hypothetical protein